jgi:hypothetical protein
VPFRRRRPHRLIALFALLGLLFQQAAMAAYVCPHAADVRHEAAMSMPGCHQADGADRVRCQAHCHPQAYSGDHASVPPVPAAVLPPTTWSRTLLRAVDLASGERCGEVSARAAAPPVTIRHCTLQI